MLDESCAERVDRPMFRLSEHVRIINQNHGSGALRLTFGRLPVEPCVGPQIPEYAVEDEERIDHGAGSQIRSTEPRVKPHKRR